MMGPTQTVGTWTPAGTLQFKQGVANIQWSGWIGCGPTGEQLNIHASVPAAGAATAVFHLQWTFDRVTPIDEVIEAPGALAAGEQRYTCNIKAWGPVAVGASLMISRPVAAPFFRVGVYSDALPAGADSVIVEAIVQRGYALQTSGT